MDKIVLLSPHDLTSSIFAALPERWRHRIDVLDLERLRAPTPGRIGFTQVAKFKGLESPFVMLESAGFIRCRPGPGALVRRNDPGPGRPVAHRPGRGP